MLVALGGIILGAVGMQYVRIVGRRCPGRWCPAPAQEPTPVTTRTAASQPTDQAEHDEHEGHTREEHTSEQGAAPHAHSHDEPGPAATTGAASSRDTEQNAVYPCGSKGARPSKPDAHGHKDHAHKHGTEQPRQANTKGAHAAKTDPHRHYAHAHGHEEEQMVRLSAAKAQQLGIEVAVARAGECADVLTLPGTIALNADRRVHVVSRIPGIVQEIRKQLGDAVRAGEVMAVIDSRELADTKAAYLAARERDPRRDDVCARERPLGKENFPEEDYLKAKQALAEVRIELQVAAQKLRALGFAEASVQQLAGRANASLTRYEVVALRGHGD